MPPAGNMLPIDCLDCSLHTLCLVAGLNASELDQLSGMVSNRRRVKRGASLYQAGDRFEAIYPIRLGSFKARILSAEGREQIIGFPLPGDLLGFDAVSTGRFQSDAVALEDAEVCVIPFEELEAIGRAFAPMQQRIHRVFSREIVRDQSQMMMLGTMRAEERVAAFLLNLSERLTQRGFSAREFVLRMTREEIGNYLGLKLETVSRTLSKLQERGVIAIVQKQTTILDPERLRFAAGGSSEAVPVPRAVSAGGGGGE
jgi:CRP/FNR family transcriptional regulator